MDLESVKKVINTYADIHTVYLKEAMVAERYYKNETDILFAPRRAKEVAEKNEDGELETHDVSSPMRNADNRIPFNFHGLLVNQKAAYMFTAPPIMDIGSDAANKKLSAFLGDKYPKVCKDLCVNHLEIKKYIMQLYHLNRSVRFGRSPLIRNYWGFFESIMILMSLRVMSMMYMSFGMI